MMCGQTGCNTREYTQRPPTQKHMSTQIHTAPTHKHIPTLTQQPHMVRRETCAYAHAPSPNNHCVFPAEGLGRTCASLTLLLCSASRGSLLLQMAKRCSYSYMPHRLVDPRDRGEREGRDRGRRRCSHSYVHRTSAGACKTRGESEEVG
jgi:hypothetical protein